MKEISGFKSLKEHYSRDDIAESYENLRFTNLSGVLEHEISINFINNLLKKYKSNSLLEIAVGPGRITKDINLPSKGVGIDISNNMLKIARKNVNNPNWKFIEADINKMLFKKNSFDAVVTFRLLIHFTDSQRVSSFKKIKEVLKKDGLLIFDIGNKDYKKPFFVKSFLKFYRFFVPEKRNKLLPEVYNNPLSKKEVIKELRQNGFKVLKIKPLNYYTSFVLILLSLSKRVPFLFNFIKKIILNLEKKNKSKFKKYGTFIVVAKNENRIN